MVYESSTRRIYSSASPRPVISTSYSYSPVLSVEDEEIYGNANYYVQLPMYPAPASTPSTRTYNYTTSDLPSSVGSSTRRVESVTRTVRSSDSLGGPAGRSYTTTTESNTRDDGYGPRTSSFTSERSYGGPGGASYFSTASYKSPYAGNSFRHMSYK